ncbi:MULTISPECIES: hypothetical protein [unclassified Salinivibrio]|uniref:hypothetical protein n=1 Tax=unclassified Salinivibrio TaxID=2636825 RepID=UPI001F52A15C|nr:MULTISPECIES: hypothetical protein [unclassified Salinivibrio]
MKDKDRKCALEFFSKINAFLKSSEGRCDILLNFEGVEKVDPSGCVFLFSYIEMFQEVYPGCNIKIKYPRKIKPTPGNGCHHTAQPNHVFNHLKLYERLGTRKAPVFHTVAPPNLKVWETISFVNDSELVGKILENVCEKVPDISPAQRSQIWKVLIEAVNNCPEHAYDKAFMRDKGLKYNKTRCLFAIIEGHLAIAVADLGVGIPYTLEHGKAKEVWNIIRKLLKVSTASGTKDSHYLQGMINIKDVRKRLSRYTKYDNRGHGGADLRKAIKELKGKILIMSGKGSLMLDASTPEPNKLTLRDFNTGLDGTLIYMSIPLTDINE